MAEVLVVGLVALLIAAGAALARERRPDDPGYTPRHASRAVVKDALERAVSDPRRSVRRSLAPWSQPTQRHSDETP